MARPHRKRRRAGVPELKDGARYRFADRSLAETYEFWSDVDGTPRVDGALFSIEDRDPDGWPDYLVLTDGAITSYHGEATPDGYLLASGRPHQVIGRTSVLVLIGREEDPRAL